MDKRLVKTSKFLSLILRHKPETVGLNLDEAGWVSVAELIAACKSNGVELTMELLREVVATNDKKRFSFNEEETLIRANQGHSVEVELGYLPVEPPEKLFHGTATRFLDSIKEKGLIKGQRHHVHLSADYETAIKVGQRHGKPVVLEVASQQMHNEGFQFFISENRVWLTERVPAIYIALSMKVETEFK
jgi:putative RNA 2'-phosphotransferase